MKFKFETEVEITEGFYKGQKGEVRYPVPLFSKRKAYHVFIDRQKGSHRDIIVKEEHLKEIKKDEVKEE